ncbi:hypothetical protein BDR03DRAFT_940996 [Suillus americanus]|nr:hypothetical protein BDR03DRAFT_940996 [Suillus americanus]
MRKALVGCVGQQQDNGRVENGLGWVTVCSGRSKEVALGHRWLRRWQHRTVAAGLLLGWHLVLGCGSHERREVAIDSGRFKCTCKFTHTNGRG